MTGPHDELVRGSSNSDPGTISEGLLRGIVCADPQAWQRLAKLYTPLVYRWCTRAGLQPADAADVVQEVFRAVAQRPFSFRREHEGDTFRGWLWTVTRNKIADCIRSQRGRAVAVGGTDAMTQLAEVPAEAFREPSEAEVGDEVRQLHARAMDIIRAEFEERTWAAFREVVIQQRRPADVAEELGMTVNAVYLAKSRILRRLREELGDVAY